MALSKLSYSEISLPSTLPSYIVLTFSLPGLYLLWTIIYTLFFHPLRKYPGPLLARSSRLWYTWYFTRGQLHVACHEAHKKYGDVVRIAPDELSYIAAPAWKDIYGQRPGKAEMAKDSTFYGNVLSTGSLLMAPRERHGFLRKLLAHSFSASALREQESLVESYADLLVTKVTEASAEGTKPVNLVNWYSVSLSSIPPASPS